MGREGEACAAVDGRVNRGQISGMYRPSSLAGANSGVVGAQRVRLLRIYLSATTFLFLYGVVFTLFPVRHDIAYGNPIGGIIAIVLGASALRRWRIWPSGRIATGGPPWRRLRPPPS